MITKCCNVPVAKAQADYVVCPKCGKIVNNHELIEKPEFVIGIDPDLHKSGVAFFQEKELIECTSMYLDEIFDMLNSLIINYIVVLEYPYTTNTWHSGGRGASINVGKNQAVAIIIKEYMDRHSINYILVPPKGYSRFFDNELFFKKQTGWSKKTNKDARAAAAIAFLNMQ